jgi:putative toxin-antitoxin system antitoxin component (TIGR02293 family)
MIFWFRDEPMALKEIFSSAAFLRGVELREKAEEVFGNKEKAMKFLAEPNRFLGRKAPLEIAVASDEGMNRVLTVIGRMEYGVFS